MENDYGYTTWYPIPGVKVMEWSDGVEIDTLYLGGNATIATARNIRRCARRLHLVVSGCGYRTWIGIYSKKDLNRLETLKSYLLGKKFKRTASNNAGKRT